MIHKVKLGGSYLTGRSQVPQDYATHPSPKYIEVATGHVCEPTYGGVLYCNFTGRFRTKITPKQYLRITRQEYNNIAKGRHGRLDTSAYSNLLNGSELLAAGLAQ